MANLRRTFVGWSYLVGESRPLTVVLRLRISIRVDLIGVCVCVCKWVWMWLPKWPNVEGLEAPVKCGHDLFELNLLWSAVKTFGTKVTQNCFGAYGSDRTNTQHNIKCHRPHHSIRNLKSNPTEKVYIWSKTNLAWNSRIYNYFYIHAECNHPPNTQNILTKPLLSISVPLQIRYRPSTRYNFERIQPNTFTICHLHIHTSHIILPEIACVPIVWHWLASQTHYS